MNTPAVPPTTHLSRNLTSLQLDRETPDAISNANATVSWTSSISRYCRSGRLRMAVSLFTQMRLAGSQPNHVTFLTLLSGCSSNPQDGRVIGPVVHGYARKLGYDPGDVTVGTALIDMYANCVTVEMARRVFDYLETKNPITWNTMLNSYIRRGRKVEAFDLFDEMPERGTVSWTVLVDGLLRMGCPEEALALFAEMQMQRVEPDYVTMIALLSACTNIEAFGSGLWIHKYCLNRGFVDNVKVYNTLIQLYSQCGHADLARQVFDKMQKRTLVSWNSLIMGLASNGLAKEALDRFDLLRQEGFQPNSVTFTGVLSACAHSGLVDEGVEFFKVMKKDHGIVPAIEHYGCMVDLFSRAGKLDDAFRVVAEMKCKPNEVILSSLLAACREAGEVNLGESLMGILADGDPEIDSKYVALGNMYAAIGRWDMASRVRRRLREAGIEKKPGFSSIEIGQSNHEFISGDKSHKEMIRIDNMLRLVACELRQSRCNFETADIDVYNND